MLVLALIGNLLMRLAVALLLLSWFSVTASQVDAALTVRGYSPAVHERFDSSSFIGGGLDFSGVASSGPNGLGAEAFTRWGTLVSPSFFVSAFHFHPGVGASLRFYETNSLSGDSIMRTVTDGFRILDSDLWLGRLDQAVTADVATYAIATGNVIGLPITVVGRSLTATGQRVGTNVVSNETEYRDDFSDPDLVGTGDVYPFAYNSPGSSDEALVQGGDSGAPSFTTINNKLVLTGVHWFQYADVTNTMFGSGDTRVGSYVAELSAIINAAGLGESIFVVAVPEPMSIAIAGAFFIVAGARHRQRRRLLPCPS